MNAKSLLLVLLVAAIAVAAWFVLREGSETAPVPVGTAAAGQVGATPGAAEKADLAQAGLAKTDAGQPTVERTAALAAEKGGQAAVRDEVVIRGRLVDANKAPRAGAKVELATFRSIEGIEFNVAPPVESQRQPNKASTTTRADGTFEFSLKADHYAFLELPGELVFADETPDIQGRKGNQDLGDLVAVGCASLAGVVKDERGQPVANVKVSAGVGALGFGGFGTTSLSTSDIEGKFTVGKLRPGKWALRTASGKFLPLTEEFTLKAEEKRTDLVLVLKTGQAIAGQVLDDRGLPVAGAKVGSKRKEARGTVDIERFTADEAATTDASGFFTLAGLSGETATVRAFGGGCTAAVAQDVPVGTGNLVLHVERLAVVEGVLQGTDGTPIAGSQVRAVADAGRGGEGDAAESYSFDSVDGMPMGGERAVATTAADGTFRVESVKPGTVALLAEGKIHRPVRQAGINVLPAQHVKGVRLVADLGAVARVKVVDEAGKPVAGAAVRADKPHVQGPGDGSMRVTRRVEADSEHGAVMIGDDGEALGSGVTDAEGIAVVPGLPAGPAQLTAKHNTFAKAVPAVVTLPKVGTVEATLTLRTPGFADVKVFGLDGEAAVGSKFRVQGPNAPDADPDTKNGVTDDKGQAHVGPLAPGEYTAMLVRATGGTNLGGAMIVMGGDEGSAIGGSEQHFTVAAGKTAQVELRRPQLTKVFGTVAGVDGPASGCSIELEKDTTGQGELGAPDFGGGRTVTSGADGTFAIDDVEPGNYVLRYGKPEQVVKAKLPVQVHGERELRQDLALRTGKLRVQAWSTVTNAPIAGAEVEVHEASAVSDKPAPRRQRVMMVAISTTDTGGDSTMMTMGGQRARTGADGWAEIDDVPLGNYDLSIKHDKHVPAQKKQQAVTERQTTDCGRVEMGQAGRIRGKVLLADGKPARMAMVQCRPVGGEENSEPQPAMGGNFKLEALATGRYLVKAQALGPGGPGAFGPEVEVEVKAGETATCEVTLPAK